MAERPTIKLIDNPIAVGETRVNAPESEQAATPPKSRSPARRPRTTPSSTLGEQAETTPEETNPYAGMHKVQAPVRLFPPLWDRLEALVRELRDDGHEVDKTALLNAVLHFHGPADVPAARELVNSWRALLARPPAPRR